MISEARKLADQRGSKLIGVLLGHNVEIGYYAQNQAQLLDENLTVFDTIDRVATGDIRLKIRDILGAFMFGGEASDKKVKVLSGGERSRLAMIKLLLEPVNFLILDEPTNHLDMRTKDVLKASPSRCDSTTSRMWAAPSRCSPRQVSSSRARSRRPATTASP